MTRGTVHETEDGFTCRGCGDNVEWLRDNGHTVRAA